MSFLLKLERYADQQEKWPRRGRYILAQYDDASVVVYGTVFGKLQNTCSKGREIKNKDGKHRCAEVTRAIASERKASSSTETATVTNDETRRNPFEKEKDASYQGEDLDSESLEIDELVQEESNQHEIYKTEEGFSTKHRTNMNDSQITEWAKSSTKHKAESCIEGEVKDVELSDFLWLQTSFVRMMYSCRWGQRSDCERIIAVAIRREKFEEMLRMCVDDLSQTETQGDVHLEWYQDRSLTGDILERFVPNIRITGSVLKQFYSEWALGIKDISGYVEHQRKYIQAGNLGFVWTPQETAYMSDSIDTCTCNELGLASKDSDTAEEDAEILEMGHFTETLAEAYAHMNTSEVSISSNRSREAILYLYGAFNPIHLGHVNALKEGKHWLESVGKYQVSDTRIAIASDSNIKEKFAKSKDLCIKFEHRLRLCELACKEHPWIKISQVPVTSQPKYGDELRRELKKPHATLVLLMGSDRAILNKRRVNAPRRENKFILCIGRKGMNSSAKKVFEEAKKNDPTRSLEFFVVPTELNDISSTSIRQNLQKLLDHNMKNKGRVSYDLAIVTKMIDKKWITEEIGEYIFHNCDKLYLHR